MICDIHFTGWGKLVYFDTEEHQVFFSTSATATWASIPKLADQWKIVYDFKTTTDYHLTADELHFSIWMSTSSQNYILGIYFEHPNIALDAVVGLRSYTLKGEQLLELGEWTRIEISHEKEGGKYFLSFSVGGKELGKKEVDDYQLKNLRDVKINTGCMEDMASPPLSHPGIMRGLIVLEKQ